MPEKNTHLTTREFADRTGLSVSTVAQYIRNGKIKGEKAAGRWRISEDQLVRFKKGRPDNAETKTHRRAGGSGPAEEKRADTPENSPGQKTYSVDEFSRLTFLTPFGVRKYLKEGILSGTQDANGEWRIAAENLKSGRIRHLIR
jgi:excisionase family DNA binding protein